MSKLANSLLLDQKALAMAQADENNIDLKKYRQKALKELSQNESDEANDDQYDIIYLPFYL